MKDTTSQAAPAAVAETPKQAGESTQRKVILSLGSSAVWSERMLDTLERGIKGGQWYSLMDTQWLRMRLRSILRKREGRKGRGRGLDHQRYPNACFAELGLISLNALTRAKRANPA